MDIKVLSSGVTYQNLPESYVRPLSERPRLADVYKSEEIPVIDLACSILDSLVEQIRKACEDYGFFQIVNHGVSMEAVKNLLEIADEFFHLSVEEKLKLYSDDPAKTMRLSTSFNVRKEKVHNWRDYLRLHCYPLETYVPEWPSNPPRFKEVASSYCIEMRNLAKRLEELISLSLGLERSYIRDVLGQQGQHMAVNYYPPCPEPDLTFGLPAHTDPNAITILLQDSQTEGLQVLKDGRWMAVNARSDAFVVNLGDQMQALSNKRYRSVWHRAVVNSERARISVASFFCPADEALITAAESLTGGEDGAVYKDFTYSEYYKKFWSRNLDQQHCLELFEKDHS